MGYKRNFFDKIVQNSHYLNSKVFSILQFCERLVKKEKLPNKHANYMYAFKIFLSRKMCATYNLQHENLCVL